jgi:hypothetical protein
MRRFTNFLIEKKEEKPTVETTGHLAHAGDYLYYGDPELAVHHHEKMFNRLHSNEEDPNHPVSLKVDGGMSFVMGKDEDGKSFVSYKSGKQRFYSAKDILATGKEHYERLLIPALYTVMKMKTMPAGTAIQADHLFDQRPNDDRFTSNTIPYATPGGSSSFGFAPHSQYEVRGNDLIKVSNDPDHTHFSSVKNHVFSPKLSLQGKSFNPMGEEIAAQIQQNIGTARSILDDQGLRNFASTLPQEKKLHAALQGYSNNVARTSGVRSTDDFIEHINKHVARRKVSDRLKQKELESHLGNVEQNRQHFDALFNAHNLLTQAKHSMMDHVAAHHHAFDIKPHRDEEHEGLVATSNDTGTMAKFVREGPGGFAEKNAARTAELRKSSAK